MVLSGRDEEEDGEGRGRRECSWRGRGDKDNRGKGDDAGIRLANAFISIRRGRVTCSPLRSISSTSFARSPPSNLLPLPFLLPSALPPTTAASLLFLAIPLSLLFHSFFSLSLSFARSLSPLSLFPSRFSSLRSFSLGFSLFVHLSSLGFSLSFFPFFPPLPLPLPLSSHPLLLLCGPLVSVRFYFLAVDLFLFPQLRAQREYFLVFALGAQSCIGTDVSRLNESLQKRQLSRRCRLRRLVVVAKTNDSVYPVSRRTRRSVHMYVCVRVCIHMYVLYFSRGSAIA